MVILPWRPGRWARACAPRRPYEPYTQRAARHWFASESRLRARSVWLHQRQA